MARRSRSLRGAMRTIAIAEMYVLHSRRAELVDALAELAAVSRQDPGCLAYRVAADAEDRDTFIVLAEYADASAVARHYESEAFQRFQQDVSPLLARPSRSRMFEVSRELRPQDPEILDPRQAD